MHWTYGVGVGKSTERGGNRVQLPDSRPMRLFFSVLDSGTSYTMKNAFCDCRLVIILCQLKKKYSIYLGKWCCKNNYKTKLNYNFMSNYVSTVNELERSVRQLGGCKAKSTFTPPVLCLHWRGDSVSQFLLWREKGKWTVLI